MLRITLLITFQYLSVSASTVVTNNMDSFQSTKACHDKDGPVDITLWESTEDSRPNRNCHDSNPSISVVCQDIPLDNCCMGDENKLFHSAKSNQADGETSSILYAGSGSTRHVGKVFSILPCTLSVVLIHGQHVLTGLPASLRHRATSIKLGYQQAPLQF